MVRREFPPRTGGELDPVVRRFGWTPEAPLEKLSAQTAMYRRRLSTRFASHRATRAIFFLSSLPPPAALEDGDHMSRLTDPPIRKSLMSLQSILFPPRVQRFFDFIVFRIWRSFEPRNNCQSPLLRIVTELCAYGNRSGHPRLLIPHLLSGLPRFREDPVT